MSLELNREEFINQYPPFNLINTEATKNIFSREMLHLYVHLPFCKNKCAYCYFKSFDNFAQENIDDYLATLKQEIETYSKMPEVQSKIVKSLYFGGGTPTLLTCDQLENLSKFIFDRFNFIENFEFCVESHPDEEKVTQEKLDLLKALKVSRVSFGVQNFNDEILALNGREMSIKTFLKIYDMAKKTGFKKINIDIMSGMFGENWPNWKNVISRIIELAPENVAFYKMELYYNTKLFGSMRKKKIVAPLMSNSEEIEMIRYAYDRLQDEAGYLVSNCFNLVKQKGLEHLHRKGIWEGDDMMGYGMSSHSCFNHDIYQNTANMEEYLDLVRKGKSPVKRAYRTSMRDEIATAMVYGIKNLYINRMDFKERFGFDMTALYNDVISSLTDRGYLNLDEEALRVPRQYYIFADDICREFFLPEHSTMMLAHISRNN